MSSATQRPIMMWSRPGEAQHVTVSPASASSSRAQIVQQTSPPRGGNPVIVYQPNQAAAAASATPPPQRPPLGPSANNAVVTADPNNNRLVAADGRSHSGSNSLTTSRGVPNSAGTTPVPPAGISGTPDEARYALIVAATPRTREPLSRIERALGGADHSHMYWIPNPAKSEFGLLEAIERRGGHFAHPGDDEDAAEARNGGAAAAAGGGAASSSTYVLVASRPEVELSLNFSNHKGEHVNLNCDVFKYSRTSLALDQLKGAEGYLSQSQQHHGGGGGATVSLNQVRSAMAAALPRLQENEYYLVCYRDYSAWATQRFWKSSKRERILAPAYVERFFAIRVGQSEGVFIPITEAQFRQGWEMITVLQMRQLGTAAGQVSNVSSMDRVLAVERSGVEAIPEASVSLTEDQFKSLAVLGSSPAAGGRQKQRGGGYDDDDEARSSAAIPWWDVRRHTQRFVRRRMEALGVAVFKTVVAGSLVLVGAYCVRRAITTSLTGATGGGSSSGRQSGSGRSAPRGAGRTTSQSEELMSIIETLNPRTFINLVLGS